MAPAERYRVTVEIGPGADTDNRLAYDRCYEPGRQFFFGPPDEEYARVLRERGVIE